MSTAPADQRAAPLPAIRRRLRLFAAPVGGPRARRATDALLAVGAAVGLAVLASVALPQSRFERALVALLASFPDVFDGLWQLCYDLLAAAAVGLVLAALLRRRWSLARDLVLAAIAAVAIALVIGRLVEGSWPDVWASLRAAAPPPWFPSVRVATAGAMVIAAAPHLTRPARRAGHWLVALAMTGACVLGTTTPAGALAALLVATLGATAIHLLFGSSAGRPSLDDVTAALAELGIRTRSLTAADRQPAGQFLVHAEDERGEPLVVKVYGRDAHDTRLVATLWRAVWYREGGTRITLGRLRQVEREALLTLLARQAAVPTEQVVTAGVTAEDDALLVLRPLGRPLAEEPGHPDETMARLWQVLALLHEGGLAHGQVDDHHVVVLDDEVGLVDFRNGSIAASDERRRTDEAQALVTTVLAFGEEPALQAAHDALGDDGLGAVLPFVQLPALTSRQRTALRAAGVDLDGLRARAAMHTEAEPPELVQLRRVTRGSVLRVVLLAVAFFALYSAFAGLDLEELGNALSEASWWWIVFGALLAQTPRLTQAVSTLGASPVPLPLGPVYALQLAVSYVNLAVPTSAARIAVNIRFFQRQGVPPGSAVAVGAIDGFAGFIIQAILLVTLLVFTPASLDLQLDGGTVGLPGRLLLIVAAAAVVAIGAVVVVPRWRRAVLAHGRRLVTEAFAAVRGLRSPRRLALLFLGSLATEVLFAMALGAFARALGYSIGLDELILINVSVALLAGLLPVPGGIGVVEGGLAFGLVAAGMPEEAAFATAIAYRLAAFYLPPIWGFAAFRWLERTQHL